MLYEIELEGTDFYTSSIVEGPAHRYIGRTRDGQHASHWIPPAVVAVADQLSADWAREFTCPVNVTVNVYEPRRVGWNDNDDSAHGAYSYTLVEYETDPHDPPTSTDRQRAIAKVWHYTEPY